MAKAKLSKSLLLRKMGDHVLQNGLSTASLRPLAQAGGTSDRMLIYHFGGKDALIAEVLHHLAQGFAERLESALPPDPFETTGGMMRRIVGILRRAEFHPYITVWLDIVAAAALGNAAHRETGHGVAAFFIDWLKARLPEDCADPDATARLMLTLLEGAHALDTVGQGEIADRAIEAAFSV